MRLYFLKNSFTTYFIWVRLAPTSELRITVANRSLRDSQNQANRLQTATVNVRTVQSSPYVQTLSQRVYWPPLQNYWGKIRKPPWNFSETSRSIPFHDDPVRPKVWRVLSSLSKFARRRLVARCAKLFARASNGKSRFLEDCTKSCKMTSFLILRVKPKPSNTLYT